MDSQILWICASYCIIEVDGTCLKIVGTKQKILWNRPRNSHLVVRCPKLIVKFAMGQSTNKLGLFLFDIYSKTSNNIYDSYQQCSKNFLNLKIKWFKQGISTIFSSPIKKNSWVLNFDLWRKKLYKTIVQK